MKTTALLVLAAYLSFSAAQVSSSTSDPIVTIQPVTSIIPSSLASVPPPLTETTRTSTRSGGLSTSRLTISDESTDRPTQTTPPSSSTLTTNPSVSTTATSPLSAATTTSVSSAVASPTISNTAARLSSVSSINLLSALAVLSGAILI